MATVNLTLRNTEGFYPIVIADGKEIKLKKDKFERLNGVIETEKSEIDLKVYTRPHELDNKFWFLLSLLYLVLSVFGIFDSRYDKNYYAINYVGKINVEANSELELLFNGKIEGNKAFTVKKGSIEDNESNVYTYNKKLKTRKRSVK